MEINWSGKMLNISNLTYQIGEKKVLDNISLNFNRGKIYAITGHNGSGKSTLVKIIMGIVKQNYGAITLDGKSIDLLSVNERANLGIGYTFQQPVKFKGLTVFDLFKVILKDDKTIKKCGCEFLSRVGLCAKDYLTRELDSTLSGGELKRIELAINLAERKKINIFDEPEAGIDIWSFEGLTSIFKSLKQEDSLTIIVTHQQKILEIADEIIVLNNGKIEKQGPTQKLISTLTNLSCKKLAGER